MSELTDLKFYQPRYNINQTWNEAPDTWSGPKFNGMGNYGKPDQPGFSADVMQKTMDQIPRYVANILNQVIDVLSHVGTEETYSGADQIGITQLQGMNATTIQGALEEIAAILGDGSVNINAGTTSPNSSTPGNVYIQFSST